MAYDAVRLIDGAVKTAGGVGDMDAVRAAMKDASFDSVRGDFAFGTNQHPVQSMYMAKVVSEDGGLSVKNEGPIAEGMVDSYAAECRME